LRFLESDKTDLRQIFIQGLEENTCSLQPALKSTAPRPLKKFRMFLRDGIRQDFRDQAQPEKNLGYTCSILISLLSCLKAEKPFRSSRHCYVQRWAWSWSSKSRFDLEDQDYAHI